MDEFVELLGVNHKQALEFFAIGLSDVSGREANRQELLYTASVLAHFSQVSTGTEEGFVTHKTLSEVFDEYIYRQDPMCDPIILENVACQCLFLLGFFGDQMRRRHSMNWWTQVGSGFYSQAATFESSPTKVLLMRMMSRNFNLWRGRCKKLSRELRDQQYLLRLQ
jgi:hypothetical protein